MFESKTEQLNMDKNRELYLVINGTNRAHSKTEIICDTICNILRSQNLEYDLFSVSSVDPVIFSPMMYETNIFNAQIEDLRDRLFIPASKWIIITPEYNGSFPGYLKAVIDMLSVRKQEDTFNFKKVLLIGIATGRAGNLRGMEHLTGILNYLRMVVYPDKQPISRVEELIDFNTGTLKDEATIYQIDYLIKQFSKF
jgi:chromate reductase, NAD(P)H dehydrogenase (quinone)